MSKTLLFVALALALLVGAAFATTDSIAESTDVDSVSYS
jgi:hypothetical protein